MRPIIFITLLVAFTLAGQAHAQYGIGMYGGMQSCPYNYGPAPGSVDDNDQVIAAKKELKNANKALDKAKREFTAAKKEVDDIEKALQKRLAAGVYEQVKEHAQRGLNPEDWNMSGCEGASGNTPGGGTQNPNCVGKTACQKVVLCTTNKEDLWVRYYAQRDGKVSDQICFANDDQIVRKGSSAEDKYNCKYKIDKYADAIKRMASAADEKARAQEDVSRLKVELANTKEAVKAELEDKDTDTEADDCPQCRAARRAPGVQGPSTAQVIGGIALAALGGYVAYKGGQYAIDQNSRLGWPSNPYWAAGLGYPLLSAGIYGAMGGGIGAGGFGCAGTVGGGGMGPYGMVTPYGQMGLYGPSMGGAFGYPPGMMGGPMMGGAPYMPGMGPWGMPGMGMGMGVGMGLGVPGLGMGIGVGMGMGMPGMGMGMGMGMPGMGMGGMYPGMGMGMPGMGMGGMYPGMGMGMPGMGMGGMYPGMGMGMPGMLPYPGMGMGMPGMGGMYPGMGMGMPGMGMGGMCGPWGCGAGMGMPGMGGMYPGMGGMPGGMGMPYQMQMSQMYMAQMSAYMQAQQSAMQDSMYRQQTIMGLTQEMNRIQMQIYQISYGGAYPPPVLPYPGGSGGYRPPYPSPYPPGGSPYPPGGSPYPTPYTPPQPGR